MHNSGSTINLQDNFMKIIECPRDAMQGITDFIPTEKKVTYINQLLKVGFDTIDFGSFVSPRAIPQMRDTAEVLEQLELNHTKTKLLAIVANKRGAKEALLYQEISYLGFPLSLSETFQKRNTNQSIPEALSIVNEIQELCESSEKTLIVYLSMGFGNPYGDTYNADVVAKFIDILNSLGIKIIALSDTIGIAEPKSIAHLFQLLHSTYTTIEFGAHLHSNPDTAMDKVLAAYRAGCRRFDGAIRGYGGCPMAKDELIGNIPTESIVSCFAKESIKLGIDDKELSKSIEMSKNIFQ